MYLIMPFKTIFKPNNWYFDTNIKSFIYSDENVTINSIYLTVPFKDNEEYNHKLLFHFKRFLINLSSKIPNTYKKKITHHNSFFTNDIIPLTITLKNIFFTDYQVIIIWERLTPPLDIDNPQINNPETNKRLVI